MDSLLVFLGVVLIILSAFGTGGLLALLAGVGMLWTGLAL